jgi:hypothetical protein
MKRGLVFGDMLVDLALDIDDDVGRHPDFTRNASEGAFFCCGHSDLAKNSGPQNYSQVVNASLPRGAGPLAALYKSLLLGQFGF